jgi:hypothetical protein
MLLAAVAYVTDPQAQPTEPTYRFYAELASNELDYEGIPERVCIVDVVVTLPCEAAVRQLLDQKGWLNEWGIIGIWVPEEDSPF